MMASKTRTILSLQKLCSCVVKRNNTCKFLHDNVLDHQRIYIRSYLTTSKCLNAKAPHQSGICFQQKLLRDASPGSQLNRIPTRLLQTTTAVSQKDYYKILGVKKSDATGDIKKAYYQLAKQYHPDTNKEKGAAEKFQEIQEAYEVLGDDQKRAAYDQFGTADFSGGGGGGGGRRGGDPFAGEQFDDIFKQFFGERGAGGAGGGFPFENMQQEGRRSMNYVLNVSFMDAVRGAQKDIRVQVPTTCKRCDGSKAEPGTKTTRCPSCNGTGEQVTNTGFFHMRVTCQQCRGQGAYIRDKCRECRGKGEVMENKTIGLEVPAGVEDGQRFRMSTEHGELDITFKVADSKIFHRNGSDVSSDVYVSFAQAILGGTITTNGLEGDINLDIKPGTQSHQQMRRIGKGITRLNGHGKGDHFINIKIQLPKYLTSRQKELMVEFAELDNSISGTVHGVDRGKGLRTTKEKKKDTSGSDPSSGETKTKDDKFSESEEGKEKKEEGEQSSWEKMMNSWKNRCSS